MERDLNGGAYALYRSAEKLQQIPSRYHWAIADSALLESIDLGRPIKRGLLGKRFNSLVVFFSKFRGVYILLFLVGVFELLKILTRQKIKSETFYGKRSCIPNNNFPKFFFVGFGAGPEESLFKHYCAGKDGAVARIDQTKIDSMDRWSQVKLLVAFNALLNSLILAKEAMANLPKEYEPWRNDFLTFIGMRLGYFSYSCAWFEQLKTIFPGVAELCFLAGDTAAFAAVNAGLTTRYLQHGLIRHSLVLPAFSSVDALTHDEMHHFRQRLPASKIQLARVNISSIAPRNPPCILVASVYDSHEELRRVIPFLKLAAQQGITIHVRPHPREDRTFWSNEDFSFPILIEDGDASFDAALERIRPSLVVSWFSTALVDALYRNIIPISLSSRDDSNIKDIVYPVFRRCLHWPSDQDVLERMVFDETFSGLTLGSLRSGMEQE